MSVTLRYILDLSIVVGAVCTVWLCMPETKSNFTIKDYQDYERTVNQYVWDHYGPGVDIEYNKLRNENVGLTNLSEDFNTMLSLVKLVNCFDGITIASGFGPHYQTDWEHIDLYLDRFQQFVEKNGPYLIPPKNINAYENLSMGMVQWWSDRNMIAVNKMRIKHDWQIGNYDAALQRIEKLLQVCRAFRYQFDLSSQCYGTIDEILAIPDDLIWPSHDSKADMAMLKGLERIRAYDWDVPPQFGMFQLYTGFSDEGFDRSIMEHEIYCAAYLATKKKEELNSSQTAELIESFDVETTSKPLTILPLNPADCTYIRLCQWTGFPALRRRVPQFSEEYYQTDSILPVALAKKVPPLIYLSTRYDQEVLMTRIFHEKSNIDRRLMAYKSRVWRDEKGSWPTPQDFKQLLPEGSNLEWCVESDPQPFVERFTRKYRPFPTYADSYASQNWSENAFSDDYPVIWDEAYPERLTYLFASSLVWDGTRDGELPPEIQRNHELMFNCVPTLFDSLQPLVKSTHWRVPEDDFLPGAVVYTHVVDSGIGISPEGKKYFHPPANVERIREDRVEYVVEFNLPEHSYWVVDPEAEKRNAENPKYSKDSRILAGWE